MGLGNFLVRLFTFSYIKKFFSQIMPPRRTLKEDTNLENKIGLLKK
jgi:hypothetical protein